MNADSAWEALEAELWPLGPGHGSGSGVYAKHKPRIQSAIEAEARRAALTALRAEVKWDNPMMTHPAALKAVAEYRAMILADIDRALGDG